MPSPTRPWSLSARPSGAALATACALLLAAATAGCSTRFGPAAVVPEPPALLTSLPDAPEVSLQSAILEPIASAPIVLPAERPSAGNAASAARAVRAARAARPARGLAAADPASPTPPSAVAARETS